MSKPSKNNPVTTKGVPLPVFPIGDRVVVERLGEEEVTTPSGLVLPSNGAEKTAFGVILAAGPEAMDALYSVGINVGDRVAFGKFSPEVLRWQAEGTGRHEVSFINVKDIWGCCELAAKIHVGDWAIEQRMEKQVGEDGKVKLVPKEFRFFRAVEATPELEETDEGHFRATKSTQERLAELQTDLDKLKERRAHAHFAQNDADFQTWSALIIEKQKEIKNLGGSV